MKITKVCCLVIVLLISISIYGCGDNGGGSTNTVTVTTIAGATKWADGSGAAASFNTPKGVTSDGTNLYVTDAMNHTIRKIVISSGEVTTLAGSPSSFGSNDGVGFTARFFNPIGITIVGSNLYVVDSGNGIIRKVSIATGTVSTLAGTAGVFGAVDGVGAAASFFAPGGITTDGTNLFVTDNGNGHIRKIVISTGEVTTLVGSINPSQGITTDGTNLFITDSGDYTVKKIVISTGAVTTLAGSAGIAGSTDGIATAATFNRPSGITTDGTALYITDLDVIRKILISTGQVTTLSGTGTTGSTDGSGAVASYNSPEGISIAGTSLYVADTGNNTIRKLAISTGTTTTFAGTAARNGLADGAGAAARFNGPAGITTDGSNLYVVDTWNDSIRKIQISTGVVTTIVDSGAGFHNPNGITTDGTNLYVADTGNNTIRKIVISTGVVSTLAGTDGISGSADGIGAAASFSVPYGITTDGTNLYVTDSNIVRKIVISTGAVSSFVGTAGTSGSADGTGAAARFSSPRGITSDGANLYVTDGGLNNTIRKIVITTGEVTTLAGTAGTSGAADGISVAASFSQPNGIASDGSNLYVADEYNSMVRKVVISTGAVTTLAGSAGHADSIDGSGAVARFNRPNGIVTNGTNIYVADWFNQTIRKIH